MFPNAAVPPAPISGGGSGRLGAADPTPATQATAFFGFRAVPSTAPLSRGLTPRVSPLGGGGGGVLTAAVA